MSSPNVATPIVAPDHFLLATRDAGYRNLASALTELIDNSLQAGATRVSVVIREFDGASTVGGAAPIAVGVLDNGCGMSVSTLVHALQFGGSSRFDDRSGLGRFGMGLPNSAVSHARRLDVYSWQAPGEVYHSYLDVDEVVAGTLQTLPATCGSGGPADSDIRQACGPHPEKEPPASRRGLLLTQQLQLTG